MAIGVGRPEPLVVSELLDLRRYGVSSPQLADGALQAVRGVLVVGMQQQRLLELRDRQLELARIQIALAVGEVLRGRSRLGGPGGIFT